MSEWQPIETAPKDGTIIWAVLRGDIYPAVEPGRDDLERWNGVQVPMRHRGLADDGFDVGWSIAAPVGHGGFPDEWISGWMPLPAPPSPEPAPTNWDELRGTAPDATGGLSSEDFVRKLRDDWR